MNNIIKIIGNINSKINVTQNFYDGIEDVRFLNKVSLIQNWNTSVFGRNKELEAFFSKANENRILCISGIGGIGKTTFIRAFISRYIEEFDHLAWITNNNNYEEAFASDLLLLKNLKLEDKFGSNQNDSEKCKFIFNELANRKGKRNVLVIDNADENIYSFIRKNSLPPNWITVVVSRAHLNQFVVFELKPLAPDFLIELFKSICKKASTDEEINELIKSVGFHTLAVELLALTIQRHLFLEVKNLRDILIRDRKRIYELEYKIEKSVFN